MYIYVYICIYIYVDDIHDIGNVKLVDTEELQMCQKFAFDIGRICREFPALPSRSRCSATYFQGKGGPGGASALI